MISGKAELTYPGTTEEERHAFSVGVFFVFFMSSFTPLAHDVTVLRYKEIHVKYKVSFLSRLLNKNKIYVLLNNFLMTTFFGLH